MKQNQKAIASYKRYIDDHKHLRNPTQILNATDTKSDSMPPSATNEDKNNKILSQLVLEEVKVEESIEDDDEEDSFNEKFRQQKIQKRADHLK